MELTLTSISVSVKGGKQVGTIQLTEYVVYTQVKMCPSSAQTVSKFWDNEDQMPKIANLPKTANDLGWHSCLPKFNLTKYGLDSLYILF